MKKIIVIGGGAAGIFAAISASQCGAKVVLLEKMPKIARKLAITGKGRCNFTNVADCIKNTPRNGKFLFSALKSFSSADTVNFFESLGVKTKVERGGRVFPQSDDSGEIIDALSKKLAICGVEVKKNCPVSNFLISDGEITAVIANGEKFPADAVILATGGKSYPATGSTGDGFEFARRFGHEVTEILPALVPLEVENPFSELQGLSLRNVRVNLLADGKKIAEEFGEMLFTHFGVSGPIILTLSGLAARFLAKNAFVELEINLKPALSPEQLDARILRDFQKFHGKILKNSLVELLPAKLIPVVLDLAFLDENKRVDDVTSAERRRLLEVLRAMPFVVTKPRPISEAIVTSGGISVKEVNPQSMRSKIVKNLYFAGEILDVDALTGGFNLQIAWSTGFLAGKSAAQ